MRILFHWPTQGRDAADDDTAPLIEALRGAGHEVTVVGPSLALLGGLTGAMPGPVAAWGQVAADNAAFGKLSTLWQRVQPELMFLRSALFHGAAARLAKATRTPLYVRAHTDLSAQRGMLDGRLKALAKAADSVSWRAADRVLVRDEALAEALHAAGVPREKLTVMPGARALARAPERADPLTKTPLVVAVLAADRPDPGVQAVLNGLASGAVKQPVELTILPDDAAPEAWAAVDVALLPRVTEAGMPPGMFNAMAAGCAIVAPDARAVRAFLKHDESAMLFDPADPEFMWNAVRWLLNRAKLRGLIGQMARARLAQSCRSWEQIAADITRMAEADVTYRRSFNASRLA